MKKEPHTPEMEAYKAELCNGMGAYAQIGEKIGETIQEHQDQEHQEHPRRKAEKKDPHTPEMEAYKAELCNGMGAYAQIGEKIGETIQEHQDHKTAEEEE